MEKIIAGITILAALISFVRKGPWRWIMFAVAAAGAVALTSSGIYDVIPKPETPYQFLSITCGEGFSTRPGIDIYPYVVLKDSIPAGVTIPLSTSQRDAAYFVTCLLRNEDSAPVFNVQIGFAYYREPLPPGKSQKFKNNKRVLLTIRTVTVPHVGTSGAYLSFESALSGLVLIAPINACTLDNPSLEKQQPCQLPISSQYAEPPMLQHPVLLFSKLRD